MVGIRIPIDATDAKRGAAEIKEAIESGIKRPMREGAQTIRDLERSFGELRKAEEGAIAQTRAVAAARGEANRVAREALRTDRERATAVAESAAQEHLLSKSREEATYVLELSLASLRGEGEMMKLSTEARELALTRRKAEAVAIAGGLTEHHALVEAIVLEARANQELAVSLQGEAAAQRDAQRAAKEAEAVALAETAAKAEAKAQIESLITGLQQERAALRLSTVERSVAEASRLAENLAIKAGITDHKAIVDQVEREVRANFAVAESLKRGQVAYRETSSELSKLGSVGSQVRGALATLGVTLSAGFIARNVFNTIKEFEAGLAGVGSATNLRGKELDDLGRGVTELSTRIPVATKELLGLTTAAGRLGVRGKADLLEFADATARLGAATDLVGEHGATALGRLLNATGESVGGIRTLSSVVVGLANTTGALGSEIVATAQAIALSTAVYDVGSAKAAAYGATLASLGIDGQSAGTAFQEAFKVIDEAVRAPGPALDELARISGKTAEQVQRIFKEDASAGFDLFVRGLAGVVSQGGSASAELEKFGITGGRTDKVLGLLATNFPRLGAAIASASAQQANATALNEDAARKFGTLGGRVTLFGNALNAAKLQLSNHTGVLATFANTGTTTIRVLLGIETAEERAQTAAMLLANGLTFAATAAAAFYGVNLAAYIGGLATAAYTAAKGFDAMTAAMLRNPVTIVAVAVAATAGAIALMIIEQRRAAASSRELTRETNDLGVSVANAALAQRDLTHALQVGDSIAQMAALNRQAVLLGETIAKVKDRSGRFLGTDLQQKVPVSAIIDVDPQLDYGALAKQVFEELYVNFIAEGSKGNFSDVLRDSGYFKEIEVDIPATDAVSGFFAGIRKGAVLEASELELAVRDYQRSLEDLDPAAIFRRFELTALPADQALDLLKGKLADIKKEAAGLLSGAFKTPDNLLSGVAATNKQREAIDSARASLEEYVQALERERNAIGQSAEERAIDTALFDAQQKVREAAIANGDDVIANIERQIRATVELARAKEEEARAEEARNAAAASLDGMLQALERETYLMGLSADARELDIAVYAAQKAAIDGNTGSVDGWIASITQAILIQQALRAANKATTDEQSEAAQMLADEVRRITDENNAIIEKSNRGAAYLKEREQALKLQIALASLTDTERERELALNDVRRAAEDAFGAESSLVNDQVAKYKQYLELIEDLAKVRAGAADIAGAFGNALKGGLTGADGVGQALAVDLQNALVENLVIKPFVEKLTASLSGIGADFFGLTAQSAALQTSSATASATLIGGGQAAGAAIVLAATHAASILAAAGAAGGISGLIGGFAPGAFGGASAKGNVFNGGTITPFAYGEAFAGGAAGRAFPPAGGGGSLGFHTLSATGNVFHNESVTSFAYGGTTNFGTLLGLSNREGSPPALLARGDVFRDASPARFALGSPVGNDNRALPSLSQLPDIGNRPTLFAMAAGAGLMREAGPEAIMPLAPGPDGQPGVRAFGDDGRTTVLALTRGPSGHLGVLGDTSNTFDQRRTTTYAYGGTFAYGGLPAAPQTLSQLSRGASEPAVARISSNTTMMSFAHGGVPDLDDLFGERETISSLARGGNARESGKFEANLPPDYASAGKAGARTAGVSGSQQMVTNHNEKTVHVSMTVYAKDAGSFRASSRQTADDLRRRI